MKNYFEKISELDRISKDSKFFKADKVDVKAEKHFIKAVKSDVIDEYCEVKEAIACIEEISCSKKFAYQPVRIKSERK